MISTHFPKKYLLALAISAAVGGLMAPRHAAAAAFWWDTTTNGLWSTSSNWSTAAAATTSPSTILATGAPGSTDTVTFNVTTLNGAAVNGAETVQIAAPTSVLGMTFANTGTTLLDSNSTTANVLSLGTSGITINSGAGAVTIGNATNPLTITMTGAASWTNSSTAALTIVNAVNNGGHLLTIAGNGAGGTAIQGAIGGTGGLTKTGSGPLTLTAANTYTGATTFGSLGSGTTAGVNTISGASGSINNSSSVAVYGNGTRLLLDNTAGNVDRIGDSASVTLGTGAELNLTGNGSTSGTTEVIGNLGITAGNEIITITGAGAGQVQTLAAASFSRTGNATALIRGTSLQALATNSTRVTIGGANGTGLNFVGAATSALGTSTAGTDTTLRIIPYLVADTSIGGTGNGFLTYDTNPSTPGLRPLAVAEYAALSAAYTTPATPQNAKANSGANTTLSTTSDVTLNALAFSVANTTLNGSAGRLIVNSGAILASANTETIGSGFLSLTLGNGTWNEGIITPTSGNTLTINTPVGVTGSGGLTKAGAGTLILTAANTYTGATTINQGTLQIGNGTVGNVASGSGDITVTPQGTLSVALANNGVLSNNVVNSGTISHTVGANTMTLSGNITGTGAVTQNLASSNLVLTGTNTYTGQTAVTAGTLSIGNLALNGSSVNLGAGGTIASSDSTARTFTLVTYASGGTFGTAGTGDLTVNNLASYGASAYTMNVNNTTTTINNMGQIGSGGSFTKGGAGTLIFTSALTVPGNATSSGLTINGGTVQFGNGSTGAPSITTTGTPGVNGTINGSGTLAFNIGNALNLQPSPTTNIIVGGLSLRKDGPGTLTLSQTNTYTGATTVNRGTLLAGATGALPSASALTVNAGGTFSLANGTALNVTTSALTLGAGSNLVFDWNAGSLDQLSSTAAATTVSGNVGITLNNTTPTGSGGTLISSTSGGLNNPTYFLANNTNFTATLTKSATAVTIGSQTSATALTNAYWLGGQVTNALATMAFSSGNTSNWASAASGTSANGLVPGGAAVNVIFGAAGASQQANIIPGADMNLGSLTFNDTTAVTIGGNNTITLNAISSTAASTSAALATVTAGAAISVTPYANASTTINANLQLAANQYWDVAPSHTLTVNGQIIGTGNLNKQNSGTLILSNVNNAFTGSLNITAGTVVASDSTTYAAGDQTITSTITGQASSSSVAFGGSLATLLQLRYNGQSDATTQTLALQSTRGGILLVNSSATNATIDVDRQGGSGTNKTITFPVSVIGNSATLHVTGGDGYNLGLGTLSIGAGGAPGTVTLDPTTANVIVATATDNGNAVGNAHTFVLSGTSAGNTIAGAIANNTSGAPLSIVKTNTSTWTFNGVNTYTGTTQINGGTLAINGSTAAGSAVTVGGAAAANSPTLVGTGTVNGALTVASAAGGVAGVINPGTVGGIGTFNAAGGVTFNSGGTLALDINATTSDLLAITGAATVNSGAVLSFNQLATPTAASYVLATATGGGLTSAAFTSSTLPTGYRLNAPTANELDLQHRATPTIALTTSPAANTRYLTNSNIALAGTVSNTAITGSDALAVSLSGTGTIAGSLSYTTAPATSVAANNGSTTFAGTLSAGSSTGPQSVLVTETDSTFSPALSASTNAINVNVVAQRTYSSPSTVSLGILHAGQTVSSGTSITSTGGNYSTVANATLNAYTGSASNGLTLSGASTLFNGNTSGTLSSARTLSGTVSGSAGLITGSFNLNATDEFTNTVTNAAAVAYSGQINNYAQPTFTASNVGNTNGPSSFTSSGSDALSATPTAYALSFGSHNSGSATFSSTITLSNNQLSAIYQDLLSGSYTVAGSGFTINSGTALGSVTNLAIGGSTSPFAVTFDTNTLTPNQSYTETITFGSLTSDNTSGNTSLSDIVLTLSGTVSGTPATFAINSVPSASSFSVLKGQNGGSVTGSVGYANGGSLNGNATFTGLSGVLSGNTVSNNVTAGAHTTSVALNTTSYSSGSQSLTVNPGSSSQSIAYSVGESTAHLSSTSQTDFTSSTVLSGTIAAGTSTPNLASHVLNGTGSGNAIVSFDSGLNTQATIVYATNPTGAPLNITEQWRTRANNEIYGGGSWVLASDVVDIQGLTGATYVLELTYDPSILSTNALLATFNGTTWINAVDLNTSGTKTFIAGGWTNDTTHDALGAYGYDAANHYVWAVLNHNSEFAVVPEPASLGLLALGAIGLLSRRRSSR